jgi:dihydrofolate synthase/folylpolyglutamate synthase
VYRFGHEFQSHREGSTHDYLGLSTTLRGLPAPRLAGNAQYGNTATALAALESIGELPSRDAVIAGLGQVALTGRYQVLPGPVEWVFDVAHNEGSAEVLTETLIERRGTGRTVFVVGMLVDKDAARVAAILRPAVHADDLVLTVTLDGDRGRPGEELAAQWSACFAAPVRSAGSVESGCVEAESQTQAGDRVVVFGSFHTVAPALAWYHARA